MKLARLLLPVLAAATIAVPMPSAHAVAPVNATMTYVVHPGVLTPYAAPVSRNGELTIRNATNGLHTFSIQGVQKGIAAGASATWTASTFNTVEPVTIADGALAGQPVGVVTTIPAT